MPPVLNIDYLWVPSALGGHSSAPWLGMRPTIRWQGHLREHLDHVRGVECTSVAYDPRTTRGSGTFRLLTKAPVPTEWLVAGSLVELLDGHRVLAVGAITPGQSLPRALSPDSADDGETIRHYMQDLVHMLRESAGEARTACGHGDDVDAFESGRAMAYAEVLLRMQTLADAFMLPRVALGLDGFDPAQDLASAGSRPVP